MIRNVILKNNLLEHNILEDGSNTTMNVGFAAVFNDKAIKGKFYA